MASKKTKKSSKKSVSKKSKTKRKTKRKKSVPKLSFSDERQIALDFASQVHKKFDTMIKATVLFGSQAKNTAKTSSDIDVIIIVDDASISWDMELIAWYREELGKIISANKYSENLHINTIKLTTWWEDLMRGDPVVINILRYGEALIDIGGFFNPVKALLLQGKIHSTAEAVYTALQRAPSHLIRSRRGVINSVEGIFWAMVDSAHAALITLGKLPPSPEHISSMLRDNFVEAKMMPMEYATWYRNIFLIHKGISHDDIKDIKGSDIDIWQERAGKFIKKMTEIIDKLLEAKKFKG